MDLQLPMQSIPITTNVVSSNPAQAVQHYVIKFVSYLRQIGCIFWVLRFPHDITEILLKVVLNAINQATILSYRLSYVITGF